MTNQRIKDLDFSVRQRLLNEARKIVRKAADYEEFD